MKFENIDTEENNYIIVRYMSEVYADINVFIKILFDSDYRDINVDSGYGEYESHTSEKRKFYYTDRFEIDSITDEYGEDKRDFEPSDIKIIYDEAKSVYEIYFDGKDYDDIISELRRYMSGGKVISKSNSSIDINSIFANPQKFMPYDGRFLYPPRIESKMQPISVSRFDNNQFIAQPKLNGSNTSVSISANIAVPKERHNNFFANPPKFDFKALHRGKGFMCLTGEFMNKSKKDETGKPFRGFCIWDIVAYEGKILIGSTIEERIKLLDMLYPSQGAISSKGITYLYKTSVPDIYKVANFYSDFSKIYNDLSKVDMVEGFVLKRKNGKLEMMLREQNNTGWAVKVRKPTANYMF